MAYKHKTDNIRHTDATKKKMSDTRKGVTLSPERLERLKATHPSRTSKREEWLKNLSEARRNISDVTRAKMRAAKLGVPKSAEHRANMAAAQRARVERLVAERLRD